MSSGIEQEGLEEALRTLDPKRLNEPIRLFLWSGGQAVKTTAQARAPIGAGTMKSSIKVTMSKAVPPRWSKIGSNVRSGGFPYPAALEGSGRYHYRGGGQSGAPTRGWFSGAVKQSEATIKRLWSTLEKRILEAFEA